jgi:hypothetical protein
MRASLALRRTFVELSSLLPHDDIAHVACYLIDYEQLHRPIGVGKAGNGGLCSLMGSRGSSSVVSGIDAYRVSAFSTCSSGT